MSKVMRIEVDKSLGEVLENLRYQVAMDMKEQYGINEITVPRTLSSKILAAKHKGQKVINFKINKVGKDKGFLQLL